MTFASIDDLVAEISAGKTYRADWMKAFQSTDYGALATIAAGRWYDGVALDGGSYRHGNFVTNGDFRAGLGNWTASSANIAWDAANTRANKTGASSETLTQNTACVNGVSYEVIYTVAGFAAGTVTISVGGTAGTARSSSATFTETIVCGATANAPVVFTFSAAWSAGGVEIVSVRRLLGFTPYTDSTTGREAGIWHGGNVSTDTKHLINMSVVTNNALGAPGMIYLVDLLGAYPKIVTNSGSVQNLNNTLTLPRYTDGVGVRAFYSCSATNGANAQNFSLSYTNTASASGRSLGAIVANTASAGLSHLSHSGVGANNFGPFLPLQGGDAGIKTVESAQFSTASASAGFIDLVLCKPLAAIPVTTAFITAERDLLTQLPSLPRIYDGAVLGILFTAGVVTTASATLWNGSLDFAWG